MPTFKCPYCGSNLDQKPKRKRKCPSCENPIFVRKGELKTEREITYIRFIERFDWLNLSVGDLEREQEDLSRKFGNPANPNDAIWSILNQALSTHDNQQKMDIYQEMADIASKEGKDPSPYLDEKEELHEYDIKNKLYDMLEESNNYEREGIRYEVRFYTCNDDFVCDRCKYLASKPWRVYDLLDELPINCTDERGCRCWISGGSPIFGEIN